MPNTLELLFIGLCSGALASALGAGGGFATFVLLVAFGVDPHTAVGSSLMSVVAKGAYAAVIHRRRRTASIRLGLALGLPAVLTAMVGAYVGHRMSDRQLTLAFGALTGVVGVALTIPLVRARLHARSLVEDRNVLPVSGGQVGSTRVEFVRR